MYIRRKVFSVITGEDKERLYSTGNDELDELLERAFCNGYEYAQKEFGKKSAILGILAPGAYQAKEAAKYAYDEDEYKNKRLDYALKGAFTPGVATHIKKEVEKMAKEGKSKKEIREFLEGDSLDRKDPKSKGRTALGIGEVALSPAIGYATTGYAAAVGLQDKRHGNRASFNSPKKKDNK